MATHRFEHTQRAENRDAITGEPASHPVAAGAGAVAGGLAAGAALGAVGGPLGAAAGAVVGGVLGGLMGKEVGEQIDPTSEDAYWRENYHRQPYADPEVSYENYQPAYRHGWESRAVHADKTFEEAEPDLKTKWERQQPNLEWEKAHHMIRDGWLHADRNRSYTAGPSMKIG